MVTIAEPSQLISLIESLKYQRTGNFLLTEILQTNQRVDLKDLNPDALVSFLAGMGKEKFRAEQVLRWIYQRGVEDFAEMTDLA